jgi:pantetheine-phosphate adenylyltransferase
MTKLLTGIYPGTFDPITVGHQDIIRRGLKFVDKLIVAVAVDTAKTPIFSLEERVSLVQKDLKNIAPKGKIIEVKGFEGLLVDFAKKHKAAIIIRGLRAVSDFEYEFQMSCMNGRLNKNIETVFLPATESTHFIASRFVKEIARLGGDISGMVSKDVAKALVGYYK